MKPPRFRTAFLFFIYLSTSQAVHQCRSGCHGSPKNILRYESGSTYTYELDGTTITTLAGAGHDVAKLGIQATVTISAHEDCDFVIKIVKIHLTGPDGKKRDGKEDLIGEEVKFNMHNGHIETEICAADGEHDSSLNIKRAVISLLQTQSHHQGYFYKHETDIFGVCPTSFDVTNVKDGNMIVKKTKSLNSCAHREDIKLPFLTTPYRSESEFQSTPIMEAQMAVEQKFESGILKTAVGEEIYQYSPVSENEAGATVKVNTLLKFVSKSKATPMKDSFPVRKSIIFEAKHTKEGIPSVKTIISALKKVADNIDPAIKEDGAVNFAFLVKILAQAKKTDILNILSLVKSGTGFKNKDLAKKILLDAIVRSESSSGVETMAELLKKKEVTGHQAKMWLLNFGYVKHASISALKSTMALLEEDTVPDQAFLGIGMLISKYCQDHRCDDVLEVTRLEKALAKPLFKTCKPTNFVDENTLIASLKGLGNIRYLTPEVVEKLSNCVEDKSVRMRVRVAVLETMRTDANKKAFKATAIKLLKDLDEDAEIRIKAYLVLVESPCAKTAAVIKEVLSNEKINQVGSFIVSHLRNIRSSTNPDKELAKHHLGGIYATEKFPFDVRKFSQNYELSYSLDNINVGAAGESNVIFSQKSYLPRSLSLNISTQLFGHSFNLFEVGARAENLDLSLEKIFGPRGYLKNTEPNDVLYEGINVFNNISYKVSNSLRPRRSTTPEQLNSLYNKVDMGLDSFYKDFLLDFSVKMYGSEIGWFKYHGDDISPLTALDRIISGFDFTIDKARNLDMDYTKHSTFLDGEIVYPTGLGFPLKLKTIGSSALRVKLDGKLDAPALIRDPLNTNIKLLFVPSAAIELSGFINIDGYIVETGVKVALNIHSSTGTEVSFKVLNGQGIDVQFGLPLRKQEIVTAKSEIMTILKERDQLSVAPIKFDIKREEYSGCFDQLSNMLGLTFCGEVSLPWEAERTLSPVYGPSKFSLFVEVDDPNLTTYHFKTYFKYIPEKQGRTFEILLDTPESSINRKINLFFESGSIPNKYFSLKLATPWKTLELEGTAVNTKKEVSLSAKFNHDGEMFSAKFGVIMVSSSGNILVYEPFLEYKIPVEPSKLLGRRGGSKFSAPALTVSGSVTVENKSELGTRLYTFKDFTLQTQRSKYSLDGVFSASHLPGIMSLGADLKVSYDGDIITIKSEVKKKEDTMLYGFLHVVPSEYPDMAVYISSKIECVKTDDFKFGFEFDFVHGPDPESKNARFTITHHVLISGIKKQNINMFAIKHFLGYPIMGIEGRAEMEWFPGNLKLLAKGQFDEYLAEGKLSSNIDPNGPYDIDIMTKFLESGFRLIAKRELVDPYKSKFTNTLEVFPNKLYQFNSLIVHKFLPYDWNFNIEAEGKTPFEPKDIKFTSGLSNNEERTFSQIFLDVDSKVYVDFLMKHSKKNLNGNYKLLLPQYVESKGEYVLQDTKLNGKSYLLLVKSQRKMEAVVDLSIVKPKYSGTIDFSWDTSDKSKSLKITTDTSIENQSFETKNALHYDKTPTNVNFKWKKNGDDKKWAVNIEGEIISSVQHLNGKYSQSIHLEPGNSEAEYIFDVSHKCEEYPEPRKLNVRLVGKHIDLNKGQVDGQLAVAYSTYDKHDLNIHLTHKKLPNNDKWIVNCQLEVDGSLVAEPIKLKLESELSENLFTEKLKLMKSIPPVSYHLGASFGQDVSLDSHGKISGNSVTGEITVKLPKSQHIKSFKWTSTNIFELTPTQTTNRRIKMNNIFNWDNYFFKLNNEMILEEIGGTAKIEWESDYFKISKRSLLINSHWPKHYHNNFNFDLSMKLDWEGKPTDFMLKYEMDRTKKEGTLSFFGNCPTNGKFDLKIISKTIAEGKGLQTDLILDFKGKSLKGLHKVVTSEHHPLIELYIEDSTGKSGFLWKADKKGLMHWAGEFHLEWAGDNAGHFKSHSEFLLKSIDNFLIKINANSNKYNIKDWDLEVGTKKDVNKEIEFSLKNDNQVLLTGTATYEFSRKSDGLFVLEGTGQILIENELRPLTVKTVWRPLVNNRMFNTSIISGDTKLTAEFLVSPSNVYIVRKFCSPRLEKKCSEAKIISNFVSKDITKQEQNIEVVLDFSLINPSYNDFSFKSTFKKDGVLLDQSIDLQWTPKDKISYKGFVLKDKAGFVIGLPKRTVAGDIAYDIPTDFTEGRLKIEGNLWLNKIKKPAKKTSFLLYGDVAHDKEAYAASGEAKFSHPSLSKEFLVKGKTIFSDKWVKPRGEGHIEFDLFRKTEDKIITIWKFGFTQEKSGYSGHSIGTLKSKGLKLESAFERRVAITKSSLNWFDNVHYLDTSGKKRDATFKVDITPKKFHILVKSPDTILYEVNYKIEKSENRILLSGAYDLAGSKYKESVEVKNSNNIIYQFNFGKGAGDQVLRVDLGYALGQIAEFKADLNKEAFFEFEVALDEVNFLKSKYNFNTEIIKNLWRTIGSQTSKIVKAYDVQLRKTIDTESKEITELIKLVRNSLPDTKPLTDSYTEELEDIKDEILSDETLQLVLEPVKEVLSSFIERVVIFLEETAKLFENFLNVMRGASEKIEIAINEIEHLMIERIVRVSDGLLNMAEDWFEVSVHLLEIFLKKIKEHEDDIKSVISAISEVVHDFGKLFAKFTVQIKQEVEEYVRLNMEQIRELPIFELIKEKIEELKDFKVPEEVLADFQEFVGSIIDSAPNPELKQFITTITNYIEKLMKREPVNTNEAIKHIYSEFIATLRPTFNMIYSAIAPDEHVFDKALLIPLPAFTLWKIPGGSMRFSGVPWILSPDLPNLIDVFFTYLTPYCDDWIPPYKGKAVIVGSEVITFDGRHISLTSSCSYLLAQDFINNNFSVVVNLKNNKLKSIQLVHGINYIELKADQKVYLNGKFHEYPIIENNGKLVAWRHPDSIGIRAGTENEVVIHCKTDISACVLQVSGFYFNKLRGILGNMNYEPYDDFLVPKGQVASHESEFINQWMLGSDCQALPISEHKHTPNEKCTDIFTNSDRLMFCYRIIDPKPYRTMCDHLSQAGQQNAACLAALAYTAVCKFKLPTVSIPQRCEICDINGKELKKDEVLTFNTPGKLADIVFLVELLEGNEEVYKSLVSPLVLSLTNELTARGISDVSFSLVGFGTPRSKWPAYFTKDGKLQYDGKLSNIFFDKIPPYKNTTIIDKLFLKKKSIDIELDKTDRGIVFRDVMRNYRFRPGSVRSIIGVHAKPCEESNYSFGISKIIRMQQLIELKTSGVIFHLITPIHNLQLGKRNVKEIIGMSADEVYMVGDANTKPLRGSKDAMEAINHEYDVCLNFAHKSGGSVFAANNFVEVSSTRKQFLQAISTRITDTLVSYEQVTECQCALQYGLLPKTVCYVTDSRPKS